MKSQFFWLELKGFLNMFRTEEPLLSKPIPHELPFEELPDYIQTNIANCERCEELEIEILTAAAQINAATYRFLKLLAEFDEKGGWHGDGIKSFAHWLLSTTSRENRYGIHDGS